MKQPDGVADLVDDATPSEVARVNVTADDLAPTLAPYRALSGRAMLYKLNEVALAPAPHQLQAGVCVPMIDGGLDSLATRGVVLDRAVNPEGDNTASPPLVCTANCEAHDWPPLCVRSLAIIRSVLRSAGNLRTE